ncbi:MAG: TIM barrel protein [Pseudomonadota bacterium]
MSFSANLGFLWTDLDLPAAIHAAATAGFDAVELHWPYNIPAQSVRAALDETGLACLGINTSRGDVSDGDNGLAALTGRADEARAAIDQAVKYADNIDAHAVHVMSGIAEGLDAHSQFVENLRYATAQTSRTILIEPLNRHDAPGYFFERLTQAQRLIKDVNAPNLKIMFDCYHVARTEGDVLTRFRQLKDHIGHVQFAAVPTRGAPDHGEIDYRWLLLALHEAGWNKPFGAEYKPGGPTADTLGWLKRFKGAAGP